MRAVDIIRKKRDGESLDAAELRFMCNGAAQGTIADYQVSAFLMAGYIRGFSDAETADLTVAMVESGETVDLSEVPGVKVDKHSTGGVGDTTSLILAPLAAACGAKVAKMSGRGLGHTGGTLDKLESIPGLSTKLTREQFIQQVQRIGVAIISQTPTLVPADSKFYALRDVTATVDSIPLIASSIMSKKLAASTDAILLDVKTGRGAFMKTLEDSRLLARAMVRIGTMLGRRVAAVITDMETPLGAYIGNALEVEEAVEILQGKLNGTPLCEVSLTLCGELLALSGLAADGSDGRRKAEAALASGAGLEKFRQMVEAQGGDPRVADDVTLLPRARRLVEVRAGRSGWLAAVDALRVGEAAMRLGAGRLRKDDAVDPAVGVVLKARAGDRVEEGQPLAVLHVNDETHLEDARHLLLSAFQWAEHAVKRPELVRELIAAEEVPQASAG